MAEYTNSQIIMEKIIRDEAESQVSRDLFNISNDINSEDFSSRYNSDLRGRVSIFRDVYNNLMKGLIESIDSIKPWIKLGISRSTWYRKKNG